MKKNKIKESDNMFYESVERFKSALATEDVTIQDYNLEISNKESDKVKFEVINNNGKYGILFTYNGTVNFNSRSESCYAINESIEGIYLRKFYIMKNKMKALEYYDQIKTSSNLLDVPLFGFDTLSDDLVQEMELELHKEIATRKLINY